MFKEILDVIRKSLLEPSDFGSIRNLIKTTELAQVSGVVEKYNKKRVRRNGKNTLKEQSPEHGSKRVSTWSASIRIVIPKERSGDQNLQINVVFE